MKTLYTLQYLGIHNCISFFGYDKNGQFSHAHTGTKYKLITERIGLSRRLSVKRVLKFKEFSVYKMAKTFVFCDEFEFPIIQIYSSGVFLKLKSAIYMASVIIESVLNLLWVFQIHNILKMLSCVLYELLRERIRTCCKTCEERENCK